MNNQKATGINMRSFFIFIVGLLLLSEVGFGREKTRLMEGYDPRVPMRIAVFPATLDRAIKRTDPLIVSSLLATEMLRLYEVQELERVAQSLQNAKLDLDQAFSIKGLPVLRDSAKVDAIVNLDIYRWQPGAPGLLGKSGNIGVMVTLYNPYTGNVFWSLNRSCKVKKNHSFFECVTELFRLLIDDVETDLKKEAKRLQILEKTAQEKAGKMELMEEKRLKKMEEKNNQGHL